MTRYLLSVLTLLGCLGLFAGSARAAELFGSPLTARPNLSLGSGFDYATGDFGSDSRSDFLTIPLYLDLYPTARLDLELIIPYLYQRLEGAGAASILYRTQGGGAVGGRRSARNRPSPTALFPGGGRSSESGLGDITLTAGYILVEDGPGRLQLRPTLYLKCPTADEDRGLGTGAFDYGPGLTLGKWLGDWHLFAEGGYVLQGDSTLFDTEDYWSYNAGVGRQLSAKVYGALQALGASAPAAGAEASLEGRLKGGWRLAPKVALEGYVGAGLADGSADLTSSLAVFFDF